MMADPFAEYRNNEPPKDNAFAHLNKLITDLEVAEEEVEQLEAQLKEAKEKRDRIKEGEIPDYMTEEMGLEKFTDSQGREIEIVGKVYASIGSRKAAAFRWLNDHGFGHLIKRGVVITFNKEDGEKAQKLVEELTKRQDEVCCSGIKQDLSVAPATLTSFVNEQLKDGKDIPMDIFGVFEKRFVKIKYKEND
ncbi:MAG: hypothetical protein PVI90_19330 [Desulfobacteraceae bacterium]|jgi:hypothetical protein